MIIIALSTCVVETFPTEMQRYHFFAETYFVTVRFYHVIRSISTSSVCLRLATACNTAVGMPPFGKLTASSEKGGRKSCKARDGYILTHKSWCAKQSDCKPYLQSVLSLLTL